MTGSSTASLIESLPAALAARSQNAFGALLTDDVRWGGEQPGGSNECVNREQAVEHYGTLLTEGITLHVTEMIRNAPITDGDVLTARMAVRSPDPDDYPPEMLVRLTVRDGLICDIRILDQPPRVEVLYFDGCPNHEKFLPHLHDLLEKHDIKATITLVHIADENEAQAHRFLGSPTIRVNGRDIEPNAADQDGTEEHQGATYGMQCRLYATAGGLAGTPDDQWILDALIDTPRPANS